MRLVIAILLATMSFPAFAQDNSNIQEIDFEALDIDGEMVKLLIIFTGVNTGLRFNLLIELRYDFNLEMSQSVNDIK
jgi:hypothetical protein